MIVKVPINGKNLQPDIVNLLLERVDCVVLDSPANISRDVWNSDLFGHKLLARGSTGLKENWLYGRIWASFYFLDCKFLVASVDVYYRGSYSQSRGSVSYNSARKRWGLRNGMIYSNLRSLVHGKHLVRVPAFNKPKDCIRLKSTVSSIEIDTEVKGAEGKKLIFSD